MLRRALSLIQLPAYIWRRLREQRLARQSPAADYSLDLSTLPEVRLEQVETERQKKLLLDLFLRNPSPFLRSPESREALEDRLARGIEYYLVYNEGGDLVGARAFRSTDNFMLHTVTDYQHRRHGYRMAASFALLDILRERGIESVHANAIRKNTRMLRGAESAGWTVRDHPTNRQLVKMTKQLKPHHGAGDDSH